MRKSIPVITLCLVLSLLSLVSAYARVDHNNNANDKFGPAVARLLDWIMEWKQRPGDISGLYLLSCWGEIGVLEKRYQSVMVSNYHFLIPAFQDLYHKTGDEKFLREILAMVDCGRRTVRPG